MRTISFSMSDQEHEIFTAEAATRGLTVSQYCKMAAFSHLAKYGSKGLFAEIIKLLRKDPQVALDPTNLGSQGNSQGELRCEKQELLVSVRGLAPLTPER